MSHGHLDAFPADLGSSGMTEDELEALVRAILGAARARITASVNAAKTACQSTAHVILFDPEKDDPTGKFRAIAPFFAGKRVASVVRATLVSDLRTGTKMTVKMSLTPPNGYRLSDDDFDSIDERQPSSWRFVVLEM